MTSCQLLISICGKISCNLDLKLGKISHIASIYIGNLHVSLHWGCTKSPTVLTMEVEHLSWVSLNSLRKKFPPKSEMDLQTGGCSMFKVFLPTNPRSLEYLGWLFPWSCNFLLIRSRTPTKPDSEHLWTPHFLKETYWIVFLGTFPLCIIMAWTGFTNSLLDCFFGVILASCASTSFSCPARPHVVAVLHTQLCFICFSDQFNYPSSPSRIALVASARRGRHQGPISRYPMNGWAKCTSCHWTSSKDHLRWNFNKTPIDQAGKLNAKQRTECFGQKVGSSVPKWFEVYTYATCNIM